MRVVISFLLATACSQAATGGAQLFEAIRANDEKAAAALLDSADAANLRTPQGATPLMQAALHASPAMMKRLLDRGADVNVRNPFGATALMWAAGDPAKVKLLLERGADVNAKSNSGRTALMIASATAGNAESLRLLLAKGADPKIVDANGDGPLGNAASAADPKMIQVLLAAGASVNERGNRGPAMRGMSPLTRAAGANCVPCVKLLLAHKSDVNAVSAEPRTIKLGLQELGSFTPLVVAAQWGNPELIRPLLDAGASLESADSRGLTPLMMAVTSETQNTETVRMLLDKGAKTDVRAHDGQTPIAWAHKFGPNTEIAKLLSSKGAVTASAPSDAAPTARTGKRTPAESVERSLALLLSSNTTFFQRSGCVGCHHQMLTGLLVGRTRQLGLRFDDKLASKQLNAALTVSQPVRESALLRVPGGGAPIVNSLFLMSLAAQDYAADALTDALVHDLAGLQRLDGSWLSMNQRPPMQASQFTETAYAVRALLQYGSPGRRQELDRRIAAAQEWLVATKPASGGERAMQLLGLHWSGTKQESSARAAKALLAAQRNDGGWAERPGLPTDAYASGQALYALQQSGHLSATDAAFERGTSYLLRTQYEDGSWHVASRSVKFQPYFESGFPHGHDQWISAAATTWAALALSLGQ
jgi:ankyrin repeat protein